jgi:metal-dependent hydrolase (beta-lactamase superfamily II)
LGLCHCTGLPAMGLFAQEFPNVFFYNSAGDKVDLFEEKEE